MYCFFCGAKDVVACQGCGRWACSRHRQRWLHRTVCMNCRKRVWVGLVIQVILGVAAIGFFCLLAWLVFRSE